ncbi:protein-export membrane protein SecF [Treponema vincentii F0403]|uniref:Protein-export membrane protein SecF n=1 Tax=Treponema vincentii F0403 TaxID=1125702 RepID=S3LAG8_9SPIR|nr:protein translocase subunit SecF [Treponema vincentii]EPF46491.1 protein-export membrane protein SecF [Treponema vincentii F0403]
MKKTIKFSKLFGVMVLVSSALIISGLVGLFTKGINFGIDFQAGFIEKVRFAPSAFILTYNGEKNIQVAQSSQSIDVTVISTDSENRVYSFRYGEYPTVGQFIEALQQQIDGIKVNLLAKADTALQSVFITSEISRVTAEPFRVHYIPEQIQPIDADEVRHALASIPSVSVQQIGEARDRTFQIRLPDNGTYTNANAELRALINTALVNAYEADNFAVLSTDFVGSRFSGSLARQAVLLVVGALFLIFFYALVRFRWTFALGAVLALVHDVLIMLTFIVWTQMEFNSTTIAAILTIVGYSINDTVVVFDRIRENIRLNPKLSLIEVLDLAQTEVLSRTIITTVTTMLAAVSLYIFTTGTMKDFALALLVGMTSGVYSTIYIAGACITFFSGKKQAGDLLLGKEEKKAHLSEVTV